MPTTSTMFSVATEIMRSRAQQTILWLALLLFLVAGLFQIPGIINRFIEPYEVPAAKVLTPQVKAGTEVEIEYGIIRRRICRVDLDRFFRAVPSGKVVHRDRTPGGVTPVSWKPLQVVNAIKLPPREVLPPGRYTQATTVTNECGSGEFYFTQTPTVEFEVVE